MSYLAGIGLQTAVFSALEADAALGALVAGAIFDAAPGETLDGPYVVLGEENVSDASDGSGAGAVHDFTVTVFADAAGFARAKAAAARVVAVLEETSELPGDGRLVSLLFRTAKARRAAPRNARRIDLLFRARIDLAD